MRITKQMQKEYDNVKRATKRKVANTVKNLGSPIVHDIVRTKLPNGMIQNEVVMRDIRKEINIPSLDSFKTKKEFNEWMYEQRKFTSGKSPHAKFSKNEHGTVMTDYLKTVLTNKHHNAEKERLKEVALLEKAGLGEKARQESVMLKRSEIRAFVPIKLDFNKLWNLGDIERKLAGLTIRGDVDDIRQKKEQLKTNFIEALRYSGDPHIDALIEGIKAIPADEFYVLYELHKEEFRQMFVPSPQTSIMAQMVDKGMLDRALGNVWVVVGDYVENKLDEETRKAILMKDF